jgi:spore coat polysaccharide biosynthesis predicted glycosyltransferase SpsG
LRREIRLAAARPREALSDDAWLTRAPVLVSLGASDPRGLTAPLVRRLQARAVPVIALVGALAICDARTPARDLAAVRWMTAVDDVVPVFDLAGWAISAAGGTVLELAALGHPVVSLATVTNQRAAARALARPTPHHAVGVGPSFDLVDLEGVALDRALDAIVETIVRLRGSAPSSALHAAAARSLVDARGAVRVAHALASLPASTQTA